MRIAICNEDAREREQLEGLLLNYKNNREFYVEWEIFKSGTDLIFQMKGGEYDIIILDVIMAGPNGIQTAREIQDLDKNVKIGFLSKTPEFAIDSYSVRAYFYLLKPVSGETLFPLFDKVHGEIASQHQNILSIKSRNGFMRISCEELEYVEIMNKIIFFHLMDGSVQESTGTFSEVEEKLLPQSGFCKIHRSYLVNLKHVQSLNAKGAIMSTGNMLPISRSFYAATKDAYISYLFQAETSPSHLVSNQLDATNQREKSVEKPKGAYRILFVDDDEDELSYWTGILREKGCLVEEASCEEKALFLAGSFSYDCVLLDVMLPGRDGFSLCQELKELSGAPVVFFSCLTDQENQIAGFHSGGLDYITKDVSPDLFWAKLELRLRLSRDKRPELRFGALRLILASRTVTYQNQAVGITPTEFDLLWVLVEHSLQIYPPKELFGALWSMSQWDGGQLVQVHMSRLRRKLEKVSPNHNFIETVWGKGYRFVPEAPDSIS